MHFHSLGFPKGHLLRWFNSLYELEIVEDDAFLTWREDVPDAYPGKGQALIQVRKSGLISVYIEIYCFRGYCILKVNPDITRRALICLYRYRCRCDVSIKCLFRRSLLLKMAFE